MLSERTMLCSMLAVLQEYYPVQHVYDSQSCRRALQPVLTLNLSWLGHM
jgi:hypothetical protein